VLLASYLVLVSAAASGLATADPSKGAKPVQIEFDAPAGCSGADAFFSSLRSRTDEVRQSDENEPHTTIQVRLTRTRGRVLGELRVVDDRGGADTRKMQGASCDDVVEALSLTAALAVDPNALLSAPATATVRTASAAPGADTNASPAVSNPPAASKPAAAAEPAVAAALHAPAAHAPLDVPWFELGAGALGTALLTSSTSPGIVFSSRFTLAGSGVLRPTLGLALAHVRNDIVQSPRALQVSLTGLAATACPLRFSTSILTIQPCALVVAGWLSASGREATYTYDVDHLWIGTGGVLHLSAFIADGLSLDLDGGVSAPLFKRRFYATTPGNIVGETPSISPIASLGLSYGF
jgi:hypothetical protein